MKLERAVVVTLEEIFGLEHLRESDCVPAFPSGSSPAATTDATAFTASGDATPMRAFVQAYFWPGLTFALFALALVSHWPVRRGFFQVDDFLWLHLDHWKSVAQSFVGSQGAHDVYRPMFRLSVYLDAVLFNGSARWSHLENVALHAANALMLARLMRAHRLSNLVCASTAILFLFAPLSGESVDWISGRTTLLSFLFILLSAWRWTEALTFGRTPWGAAGFMILAGMTYEAAVVLPAVVLGLLPLAHRRLGIDWRTGLRQLGLLSVLLLVFWGLRAIMLGVLIGYTDAASPDILSNVRNQLGVLGAYYLSFGSVISLWALAIAFIVTSFHPRLFPTGPCLVFIAAVLLLPYIGVPGVGQRFHYMMQAPLCAMVCIAACSLPKNLRGATLMLLMALLLPQFVATTWKDAVAYTEAGMATKRMMDAIRQAIPVNNERPNVIDGIPDNYDERMMMGGFFEMGIADTYATPPVPPFVARSEIVLGNAQILKDVLKAESLYWRYDQATNQVIPIDRQTWLQVHSEALSRAPE